MVKRLSKSERRQAILEAARRVFARKGYAATRMSDIAVAAKAGKGTLYEYFRGKEDLFSNLLLVVLRASLETHATRTMSADPEAAMRETIRYVVKVALTENLDLYRLFYDFWGLAASYRLAAQKKLREVAASWRAFVEELVREGQRVGVFRAEVDAALFCRAFSAAVDGVSIQIVILGDKVDRAAYAKHLEGMLLAWLTTGGRLDGASLLRESPAPARSRRASQSPRPPRRRSKKTL